MTTNGARRFYLGALLAVVVIGLGVAPGRAVAAAQCTMASAQPESGTLTLTYLRPSSKNKDRNDYRLSGTIRWGSKHALDCFHHDTIDWAYEQNITY